MGDRVSELGIVLSGSVFVENTDLWGNRSILSKITPGQVFAETYAFCREPMMVNVTAAEASTVLFSIFETSTRPPMVMMHGCPSFAVICSASPCRKSLPSPNRIFCTTPRRSASACWSTSPRSLPNQRRHLYDPLRPPGPRRLPEPRPERPLQRTRKMQKRESSNFIKTNLRCVIRLSRRSPQRLNFLSFHSFQMLIFHKRIYTKVIFRGYNHILFLLYPIFCTCKL